MCCQALANLQETALPLRYIKALKNLGKDANILILQADKGGGVVIMNKVDYNRKMNDLLNDNTTYTKRHSGFAEGESMKFNQRVRKILNKSERGKKLIGLLEEAPRPPRMRGLPKIHKDGIPMRPITSGIGSAPHRLSKVLARPLSNILGSISGAHLKNSTDLIDRIKNINLKNKKLASFDVKALFTSVPVKEAIESIKKATQQIKDEDLPLARMDFIKLISICIKFGPFTFNKEEFEQHNGLPMGSPLSPVAACLYMEVMENENFRQIMGRGATWLRYVDDILVITPRNTNLNNKLRRLNNVHERIQFTIEEENNGCLPFLDTLIMKTNEGTRFKVFRKRTNKNDFVHFYSAQSERTKSGIVLGFMLRAKRICSKEYINEEMDYIMKTF